MAQDRRTMIRAAEKLVARGKLEGAIKQYRKVLRATPDDTGTLNRVGDLYARLDRLDEAIEIFTQAAEHFVTEGFHVKAIAILKKIIRLDPTRIAVYETLADLYHRQGLRNEARSQYQVVADYHLQAGDSIKVRSIYEKMIELEPQNPSHRVKLAELYCESAMIPEAMEQYQTIAAFMLDHGRVDEALSVYRGAFDLSPSDLGFLTDVVLHLKDQAQTKAAEQLLTEAIAKNPEAVRVREVTGLGAVEPEEPLLAPVEEAPQTADSAKDADVDELLEEAVADVAEAAEDSETVVDEAVTLVSDEEQPDLVADTTGGDAEAEDGVVVLDLESGAGDLPFSVDEPEAPAVEDERPAEELEIDLDLLEVEMEAEGAELAATEGGVDPGDETLPAVEAAPDVEAEAESVEIGDVEPVGAGVEDDVSEEVEAPLSMESVLDDMAQQLESVEETAVDGELEEATVAQQEPEPVESAEDKEVISLSADSEAEVEVGVEGLLSEARMLASYGLGSKAASLCRQAIKLEPDRLESYDELIVVLHDSGDPVAAAAAATEARTAAGADSAGWKEVSARLVELGYRISEESIEAPAAAEEPAKPALPPAEEPVLVEESVEEPEDERIEEPVGLAESGEETAEDLGWLAEASDEQSFAEAEQIFGAEDEFFDLASELEQELEREDEEYSGEFLPQLQEQSLEEIVEGFKKGVSETLSEEDYETHYNLGIAYREMGLIDEAIGEFQLASKSPDYLVDCCSLLGSCFVEKGFPDLAIKWFERGLEAPGVTEVESLGLLYELGNLYLITGDKDVARKTFAEIYGVNSNYRDVVAKLEELRSS